MRRWLFFRVLKRSFFVCFLGHQCEIINGIQMLEDLEQTLNYRYDLNLE